MPKFKQHDVVAFGELKGIVASANASNPEYPVQVVFMHNKVVLGFRADGSFGGKIAIAETAFDWRTVDKLKLVMRPKKGLLSKLKSLFTKQAKPEVSNVEPPSAA